MQATLSAGSAILTASFIGSCNAFKRWGYQGFRRDRWQHPEEVIHALQIRTGERVAEIGPGGGYFTFRLADEVGRDGRVYAVDTDEGMVDYIRERADAEAYRNVEAILATPDNPGLGVGTVDLVFSCNAYHHIMDPISYFARVRQSLRPGGRVAIIDHKSEGLFARLFGHATDVTVLRKQMRDAGYELKHEYTFLSRQEFLVLAPQS